MSNPVQGNQYFYNVQNDANLSVQNLNVDELEVSQISVGENVSFFGVPSVEQQNYIAQQVTGSATAASNATAINSILTGLKNLGLFASS